MATLALSRLSSKFDTEKIDSKQYIEQLRCFDNFEHMLHYLKAIIDSQGIELIKKNSRKKLEFPSEEFKEDQTDILVTCNETLKYLLNVLENLTSVKILRAEIDCSKLFL